MPQHRLNPPGFQVPANAAPTPDLFGFVAPARVTAASSTPGPAAEWPAAGNRPARTVPVYPAGDRAPVGAPPRPPTSLLGSYAASKAGKLVYLDRQDGVRLIVYPSKLKAGATVAGRFVKVGYPGGGEPKFAGGLYNRSESPADVLDGHAFQHRKRGPWYRIVRTGPNLYRVERTGSRRGQGRS